MKRIAVVFFVSLAAWAADPPASPAPQKLTEDEYRKVRDAQVDVLEIQSNMKQLEDLYRNLQEQMKTAQPALDKAIADVKAAHKCPDCDLDKNLNLVPKPTAPAPAPSPAEKK